MESAVDATRLRALSTERKTSRDNKLVEAIEQSRRPLSKNLIHPLRVQDC
jgi:hypothetical protein